MKTYYILDTKTNTWSLRHLPLKDIVAAPGVTGSHLLADAHTQQTLTVAQALATERKHRLKIPAQSLLRVPETSPVNSPVAPLLVTRPVSRLRPVVSQSTRNKPDRSEYKVLGQGDEILCGQLDAPSLELALNTYAQQGWKVLSCVPSQGGVTADWLIIMERRIAASPI